MDRFGFGFEAGPSRDGSRLEWTALALALRLVLAGGRWDPSSVRNRVVRIVEKKLVAERRRRPPSRFQTIDVSPTKEE